MFSLRLSLVVFSLLLCPYLVLKANALDQSQAASTISQAEWATVAAYEAALEAEKAGGNVSVLFIRLNDAGKLLASARILYRNGDFDTASMLADLSKNIGGDVQNSAVQLKDYELIENQRRSLLTIVAFVAVVAAIGLGSVLSWHLLRERYGRHRGWFIIGSLIIMFLAAAPASAMYIHLPSGSESFSELWLLGPSRKAEGYPFNVGVDKTYSIDLGVGNHLGHSAYYMIEVKLRNQTQPLPNSSTSAPSSLNSTYEFQFFLADGKTWETVVSFVLQGTPGFVNNISVNDNSFPVDLPSMWDHGRNGYYYQLFFELWLYNTASQSFQFHNRFIGIWLNMTD